MPAGNTPARIAEASWMIAPARNSRRCCPGTSLGPLGVTGSLSTNGTQSVDVHLAAAEARAVLPESVPATTIDRHCGSSQQSAHFAAQGVIAGAYDVVVAGTGNAAMCAALAARDFDAAAVHVSYGQRTEERERKAFLEICERLGIRDRLVVRKEIGVCDPDLF